MKKIIGILICLLIVLINYSAIAIKTTGNNDQLDQFQDDEGDAGYFIKKDHSAAQSFIPTLKTLTRVWLKCDEFPTAHKNIIFSIRKELDGNDLTSLVISPGKLPDWNWYEFDFDDIQVTPYEPYYIVLRSEEMDSIYSWIMSDQDLYANGKAWKKTNNIWKEMYSSETPYYDFCFKTYGYDKPSNELDFYFIHMTDLHLKGDYYCDELCELIKNEINKMSPKPAFVLITGDIADMGADGTGAYAYSDFLKILSGSKQNYNNPNSGWKIKDTNIPVIFCPGNHDAYAKIEGIPIIVDFDNYKEYIGDLYYKKNLNVEGHTITIFSLNSGKDKEYPDSDLPEGDGLYNYDVPIFKNDLKSSKTDIKIVLTHHPWATCAPNGGQFWNYNRDGDGVTNDFGQWCKDEKVDLVLSGHIHNDAIMKGIWSWWPGWEEGVTKSKNDGTAYVITDSVGGSHSGENDNFHYRRISVWSNGEITIHKQERLKSRSHETTNLNMLLLKFLQFHPLLQKVLQRFLNF